jgi:hypothetical protein
MVTETAKRNASLFVRSLCKTRRDYPFELQNEIRCRGYHPFWDTCEMVHFWGSPDPHWITRNELLTDPGFQQP